MLPAMYRGFPLKMLDLLRCPSDRGRLELTTNDARPETFIVQGTLLCAECHSTYEIVNGIVRFLDSRMLDALAEQERVRRDEETHDLGTDWERSEWSEMEIEPTLEASEPLSRAVTLELGAGTGRYTVRMADRGAAILAVDFSLESLEYIARRTLPSWDIGLVHADVTKLGVAPRQFDLIASTLVSNLPSGDNRAKMLSIASSACKPGGKFVFSTHYYGLKSRLRREPRAGFYPENPAIFRYLFSRTELTGETRAFFRNVTVHPIRVSIPFARTIGLNVVRLSKRSEALPVVNLLGDLLLAVASQPVAAADERVLSQVRA